MKATINGINVEGTVDEIIEYTRKINVVSPFVNPPGSAGTPDYTYKGTPIDMTYRPQTTCNNG